MLRAAEAADQEWRPSSAPHGVDQHAEHVLRSQAARTAAAAGSTGGAGDGHQAVSARQLQARRLVGAVAGQQPPRAGVSDQRRLQRTAAAVL